MVAIRFNEPIRPMTLGTMGANGVHSLAVSCHLCHHEAIISAAPWPDDVPTADGVHALRHHRRRCATQLAGAACAREPERRPMAVRPRKGGRGAEQNRALRML